MNAPVYFGRSPTVPDSTKLVKRPGPNISAAVKPDPDRRRLYVCLRESKLRRRVNSTRLKPFVTKVSEQQNEDRLKKKDTIL